MVEIDASNCTSTGTPTGCLPAAESSSHTAAFGGPADSSPSPTDDPEHVPGRRIQRRWPPLSSIAGFGRWPGVPVIGVLTGAAPGKEFRAFHSGKPE
ncbi:hypothetical protein [Streptomyces sioyaensis]|uniref:hypothetical protein n=1 Tax=Streptomyces sioyaensis TaxID=67364 RepID=UPI0036DFA8B6